MLVRVFANGAGSWPSGLGVPLRLRLLRWQWFVGIVVVAWDSPWVRLFSFHLKLAYIQVETLNEIRVVEVVIEISY